MRLIAITTIVISIFGSVVYAQDQDSIRTKQLDEVIVVGYKEKKYLDSVTSVATRMDIKLIDLPQSAQTITRQTLKDQQIFTLNSAIQNVAGLNMADNNDDIIMRGFGGVGSTVYWNGMKGTFYEGNQQTLLYNVERIDVLRGPASALYSIGSPGGIINMITKKPQAEKLYELNFSYGSWSDINASFDAAGALSRNKKLQYRFVSGYHTGKSFRDFVKYNEILVTPSLSYMFSDKTKITLEYMAQYSQNHVNDDEGTYAFADTLGNFNSDSIDTEFNFANPNDKGTNKNNLTAVNFTHKFNNLFDLNANYRYSTGNSHINLHSGYAGYFSPKRDSLFARVWYKQNYKNTHNQFSSWLNINLGNNKIKSKTQIGAEYFHYKNLGVYSEGSAGDIALKNNDYTTDEMYDDISYYDQTFDYQFSNVAGYVQTFLDINDKLKILAALRFEHYHMNFSNQVEEWVDETTTSLTESSSSNITNVLLPRFGLVYSPIKSMSFYASYNQSYLPQGDNFKDAGGPFDAETGNQYELGVKNNWFRNRLSTTFCVYQIDRHNILVSDPSDPTGKNLMLIDAVRSKGLEITAQGNVTNDLSVIVNYEYNDVRYTETSGWFKEGDWFYGAPHHLASSWINYRFSKSKVKGLSFGIGTQYQSNTIGQSGWAGYDENYTGYDIILNLPEFFVLNAAIAYSYKKIGFGLNFNNITNTRYFYNSSGITGLIPGAPFNMRANISYRF